MASSPLPDSLPQAPAKRAALIATVTGKRYMPPWLPCPEPAFEHPRQLTDAEIATLARWAATGAAQGNPAETPAPPVFHEGWQLGKPDLEAQMRTAFAVPSEGPDLYQCFAVPSPAGPDRWVRALDISGNPKVVHQRLAVPGHHRHRPPAGHIAAEGFYTRMET